MSDLEQTIHDKFIFEGKNIDEISEETDLQPGRVRYIIDKNHWKRTKEQIAAGKRRYNLKHYGVDVVVRPDVKKKQQQTLLKRYGVENPSQSKIFKEKRQQTFNERFGGNPSKNCNIKQKKQQTFATHYGCNNYFLSVEGKQHIKNIMLEKYGATNPSNVKQFCQKRKQTYLDKYGVDHISKVNEFIEKRRLKSVEKWGVDDPSLRYYTENQLEILRDQSNFISYIKSLPIKTYSYIAQNIDVDVTTIIRYVKKYDVESLIEKWCSRSCEEEELLQYITSIYKGVVSANNRSELDGLEIDIYLPQKKIGIEYNGSYWHRVGGRKYTPKMKTQLAIKKGIRLIHIYDYEWVNNKEMIKKFLYYLINRRKQRFLNIQDLTLKEIDKQTIKQFLEENHWFGGQLQKIHKSYGLFTLDGELVSVSSFNKYSGNKYDWEWKRYCNKLGVAINGGAPEKFLEEFAKDHHGVLVDYQQMDRFPSISSERMGFKKLRWNEGYVSSNNRYGFVRHRFIPENGLTKEETMKKYGYDFEVPNAGTVTWIKEI